MNPTDSVYIWACKNTDLIPAKMVDKQHANEHDEHAEALEGEHSHA